ncbi:hypothetical protein ACP275_03G112300 [Erythranthe tilingii]
MDEPPENNRCSVCDANVRMTFQSICSHWFCDTCFLQFWDLDDVRRQPCRCPQCKRAITLLIPARGASIRLHDDDTHVTEILRVIDTYNRLYGKYSNGLIQRIRNLPFLLKKLLLDMMYPEQLSFPMRGHVYLAMTFGAVYVLSPVDFISEGRLGMVGLIDDLIIVLLCFLHVAAIYQECLLAPFIL